MEKKRLYNGKYVNLIDLGGYECLEEPNIVIVIPVMERGLGSFDVGILSEYCPPYMTDRCENYYTVVSGKIEDGEGVIDTAVRELEEEVGIIVEDESLVHIEVLNQNVPVCKSSVMRASIVVIWMNESAGGFSIVTPEGDGTVYEKKSKSLFLNIDDISGIIETKSTYDLYLVLLYNIVINLLKD